MARANKITVKFKAEGAKSLKLAIQQLAIAQVQLNQGTKAAKRLQAKYNRELERLGKNTLIGVRNNRLLNNSFATLRSKLLLVSFGVMLFSQSFGRLIKAYREQELADKKLQAAITSTASAAKLTLGQLKGMASGLQEVTSFGDEAIQTSQGLMLTFTKVGGEIMPQAIETVLNMSTAMGTDLKSSTVQLGKALNDPIAGISALSRVGVQLTADQKQSIKAFMGVGDVASAQKVILGELETQFGGLARAAGDTMGGAMDKASNAMSDAAESMGKALSPMVIMVANGLKIAAEAAGHFFQLLSESPIETTIRELQELGVNTLEIEKRLAAEKIAESEKVVAGAHNEMVIRGLIAIENKKLVANQKELVDQQLKLIDNGESEAEIRGKIRVAMNQTIGATSAAAKHNDGIVMQSQQIGLNTQLALNAKLKDVDASKLKIKDNKLEIETLQKLLDAHRKITLNKLELKRIETEIANLGKDDPPEIRTLAQIQSDEKLAIAKINLTHAMGGLTDAQKAQQIETIKSMNLAEIEINSLMAVNDIKLQGIAIDLERIKTEDMLFQKRQESAKMMIDSMQEVTSALVSNLDKRQQAEIESLKQETAYINASDNQKRQMEDDRNKKYQSQRKNLFIADKALALSELYINTELAAMKAQGQFGVFGVPMSAFIRAQGLVSAGIILSQKAPQYEYGGLVGGRRHSAGGTLIEAEQGEFVMNRNAVDSIGVGALNAMNQGSGGVTVNVSGNVLTQDFVEGELAESIQEAVRKGVSFA